MLKLQNPLEQSIVPILLFVRLIVYCGSYPIMLLDTAQTSMHFTDFLPVSVRCAGIHLEGC